MRRFEALMDERASRRALPFGRKKPAALSEATPEQCHRRLVAERLAARWPNVEIIHL
jgi:hypothetical protein